MSKNKRINTKKTLKELVSEKEIRETQRLELWARHVGIAGAHQGLRRIKIIIEDKETIPSLDDDGLKDLKLTDFFTEARFQRAQVETKIHLIRLRNAFVVCQDENRVEKANEGNLIRDCRYIYIPTVRKLLSLTRRELRAIPNVGDKAIDAMDAVLKYFGLIRDENQPPQPKN